MRHAGHEIGQTERLKASADVAALIWDRRTHTNEAIGVFPSHKEAEKAIVMVWQRRNAAAG